MPKNFADEKGFGPDIASRRLQDEIYTALTRIDRSAVPPQTRPVPPSSLENRDVDVFAVPGQRTSIIQQSDLPAITIPGVGASLDSFAVTIQTFLGLGRRNTISGEFTVFENHLGLDLGHLETTLDTFELPPAERAEVLAFIDSTKPDIVE